MDKYDFRRLEQSDLIKLIDSGELIPISEITPHNPLVVNALSDNGYYVVSNACMQKYLHESAELARLKLKGGAKRC